MSIRSPASCPWPLASAGNRGLGMPEQRDDQTLTREERQRAHDEAKDSPRRQGKKGKKGGDKKDKKAK